MLPRKDLFAISAKGLLGYETKVRQEIFSGEGRNHSAFADRSGSLDHGEGRWSE